MTGTAPFVQTVTGPVAPEELGVTMPHEHVFLLNPSFVEPQEASERFRAHEPVSESNIEWVRQYWTSNVDNLQLYDEQVAIEEVRRYYRAGGDAIVDPTTRWIARDPRGLFRVSRGHRGQDRRRHRVLRRRDPPGRHGPAIRRRPGGRDDPRAHRGDRRHRCQGRAHRRDGLLLAAAGRGTQGTTRRRHRFAGDERRGDGAPRAATLPPRPRSSICSPPWAMDTSKIIIAHIDRTVLEPREVLDLAETGVYLEYDIFGQETSMFPTVGVMTDAGLVPRRPAGLSMPNDAERLDRGGSPGGARVRGTGSHVDGHLHQAPPAPLRRARLRPHRGTHRPLDAGDEARPRRSSTRFCGQTRSGCSA